jgi:Domain of unknown function (DUF4439)
VTTAVDAAQQALAAEHAARWAYGVLTPRAGTRQPLGVPSLLAHQDQRDALVDWLRAQKADPVVARPGYALPFRLDSPAAAASLARRVEDGCARQWVQVIQAAVGERALLGVAQAALADSAARRVRWGGVPDALPGISP